jgi:phosphoribosylformylglycinamidine cyclo-ligase
VGSARIFGEIQRLGDVDTDEMRRVFNCGIGMVLVVPPHHVTPATAAPPRTATAVVIGEVTTAPAGDRAIRYI